MTDEVDGGQRVVRYDGRVAGFLRLHLEQVWLAEMVARNCGINAGLFEEESPSWI